MQRPAVQPVDHERAVDRERAVEVAGREPGRACADGEPGAAQVLCLHREQPLGHRDRVPRRRAGEELGDEAFSHIRMVTCEAPVPGRFNGVSWPARPARRRARGALPAAPSE